MIEVRQTAVDAEWFAGLRDRQTRTRIDIRIRRLSPGNAGDVKPVGDGVCGLRIPHGPGCRAYLVNRGGLLVILLAGGDKSTQDRDIRIAKDLARDLWELNHAQDRHHAAGCARSRPGPRARADPPLRIDACSGRRLAFADRSVDETRQRRGASPTEPPPRPPPDPAAMPQHETALCPAAGPRATHR